MHKFELPFVVCTDHRRILAGTFSIAQAVYHIYFVAQSADIQQQTRKSESSPKHSYTVSSPRSEHPAVVRSGKNVAPGVLDATHHGYGQHHV